MRDSGGGVVSAPIGRGDYVDYASGRGKGGPGRVLRVWTERRPGGVAVAMLAEVDWKHGLRNPEVEHVSDLVRISRDSWERSIFDGGR